MSYEVVATLGAGHYDGSAPEQPPASAYHPHCRLAFWSSSQTCKGAK